MEPSSRFGILTFQMGGQAMSQIDPWEKAAECARAVENNNLDPHRKAELTVLQHMWLALAAERGCLSPLELAQEIEKIASLHTELAEGSPAAH
jgi:hypothetical protein